MIIGTSHFPSEAHAVHYYRRYGVGILRVRTKIRTGEIAIGKPDLKPGDKLILIDGGNRYGIEEAPRA